MNFLTLKKYTPYENLSQIIWLKNRSFFEINLIMKLLAFSEVRLILKQCIYSIYNDYLPLSHLLRSSFSQSQWLFSNIMYSVIYR